MKNKIETSSQDNRHGLKKIRDGLCSFFYRIYLPFFLYEQLLAVFCSEHIKKLPIPFGQKNPDLSFLRY